MDTCEEILDALDGVIHRCAEPPGHEHDPDGFPLHRDRARTLVWP
ncbi:MAG: hypothetical protein ACRD0P_10975 [Stackebrandtia sp.]